MLLAGGCAQLPPSAADLQAKHFDSVPGKAVIYIVRPPMDSWETGMLTLDDSQQITTYRGTYYRWEVPPGRHHVAGYAGDGGSVFLMTEPGKIYFVRHTVLQGRRPGATLTWLQQIGGEDGRSLVAQAQLLE